MTQPTIDTSPAIHVEDLRKVYGNRVAVVGLTLEVARGEVFGFLGPNGAGKTTTVKMMAGLIRPTSGRISILGRPLGDKEARRRVGFLPEQFQFFEAASFFHGGNHTILNHRDSGGIVTSIFEVLQVSENRLNAGLIANNAGNTAHIDLILCERLLRRVNFLR